MRIHPKAKMVEEVSRCILLEGGCYGGVNERGRSDKDNML